MLRANNSSNFIRDCAHYILKKKKEKGRRKGEREGRKEKKHVSGFCYCCFGLVKFGLVFVLLSLKNFSEAKF